MSTPSLTIPPSLVNSWERRALAAEKTAGVLAQKVKDMYEEGTKTTIHRQLERAQKRTQAHKHRQEIAQVRARELERHSVQLEREVARRTADLKRIFDNVLFGFAIVDKDLTLNEGFTRSCHHLFGQTVQAGDNLAGLLSMENTPRHAEMQLALEQIFDDYLPEELALAQFPSRFVVADRVLALQGRVLRDAAQQVESVLLTISDNTDLERARDESRCHQTLIQILRQKSAFQQFVQETRTQLCNVRETPCNATSVRRLLHTIKGNAASYKLDALVETIHALEQQPECSAAGLRQVDDWMRQFLHNHFDILGIDYDGCAEPVYPVTASRLQDLHRLLQHDPDPVTLWRWAAQVPLRPAHELLGPLSAVVARLAQRLNKDIHFVLEGSDTPLDPPTMKPVLLALPHLIHNAIDHGIEAHGERGDKPPQALLTVTIADSGGRYTVTVQDDGRGIDTDALAQRALAQRLCSAGELAAMSHEEKLALAFLDGLSSTATPTDLSGRGVGMAAIQSAVAQQGGSLALESQPGKGTRIQISLPKPPALQEKPSYEDEHSPPVL